MKIFSNFDTQFKKKVYQEFVMEYGEQNILLISRSRLFGWLYIYVPALSYISACVLLLVILSNYSICIKVNQKTSKPLFGVINDILVLI